MKTKVTVTKKLTLSNEQIAQLLKMPKNVVINAHTAYDSSYGEHTQVGLTFAWSEEEEKDLSDVLSSVCQTSG